MAKYIMLKHTVYHSTSGAILYDDLKSYLASGSFAGYIVKKRIHDEYNKLLKYIEKRWLSGDSTYITLDNKFIKDDLTYASINFREASRLRGKDFMAGYLYTTVEWRLVPTKQLELEGKDKIVVR